MFPIRVKTVQESDLRMLGNLARNIQRVLPVTQADIDAAAALGKGWVVWKVFEVSDPLDNLRGGTQLIIRQNSIQPGQNVRRVLIVSGPGGQTVVIRGTDYIVLPDAIANSLRYVKAFGGTEQNGTPTPDAPVDIVSNNGVLKARHQSGLPLGYTLVESIGFTGAQYINTGLAINNNTRVLFDVKRSTSSAQSNYPWLGGVRDYINNTNINKKTLEFSKSDSTRMYLQYSTSGEITLAVPSTTQRHTYDFNKNKLYVDDNLIYTATQETFTGSATFLIGTVYSQGSVSIASMFYGDVYGFKLWQDGTNLSMNLIPAKRNSDNVLGMYDTVSGTFFTNAGTGDFVAGNPVDDLEIYTDGTVETINVHGKNLFDQSTATRYRTSWSSSGGGAWQAVSSSSEAVTYGSYVKPNTTYTLSKKGGSRLIITGYRTKTEPLSSATPADYQIRTSTTEVVDGSYTFTTPADCTWILFGLRQNNTTYTFPYDVQLEQGSTATEYVPYYDGGTATAEMLLKVGDYQDEQEIISGIVTRKVGVKVLDGTENWTYTNSRFRLNIQGYLVGSSIMAAIISHYKLPAINMGAIANGEARFGKSSPTDTVSDSNMLIIHDDNYTDLNSYKTWLAAQYAAGTPVIVIYPLATPTTESVTGQTLQVTAGDNVLEITQASLTGLELEATYKSLVQLTIQEVEDANLDNDVTVTIQ